MENASAVVTPLRNSSAIKTEPLAHCNRALQSVFHAESVVLQPGQQPVSGRTDHVRLREVDVHIHKPGRKDAPRQVGDRLVCVLRAECLP